MADTQNNKTFDDIGEISNVASSITTYGALILPFDPIEESVENNPKETTNFKGKLTSALKNAGQTIKNKITNPTQTFKDLAKYMKDNRNEVVNTIGSKFSGIAVAQAIINGNVTSQEALDYLFMGFAPALGVQGSLMGYSGLNQMKEALSNGTIDVGSFVSGFSRTLKGVIDFKDMITNKKTKSSANIIEFDLTLSHSESYQAETPDRRVQSGQSLNEYIHNMPETIEVQCALQEGKRYSKSEFRAILDDVRKKKESVSLVLGDEVFTDLVLTGFSPSHDCSRSGMDYSLSFKKIIRSDVRTDQEVIVQTAPELVKSSSSSSLSSSSSSIGGIATGGANGGVDKFDYKSISAEMNLPTSPMIDDEGAIGSTFYTLGGKPYQHSELNPRIPIE